MKIQINATKRLLATEGIEIEAAGKEVATPPGAKPKKPARKPIAKPPGADSKKKKALERDMKKMKGASLVKAAGFGSAIKQAIVLGEKACKAAGVTVKDVDMPETTALMFTFDKKKQPTAQQAKQIKNAFVTGFVKDPYKVGDFKKDPDSNDMVDDPKTEVIWTMVFYHKDEG